MQNILKIHFVIKNVIHFQMLSVSRRSKFMDEEDIRQRRETEKRKQERKANEENGKKIVKVLRDGKQVQEIQR